MVKTRYTKLGNDAEQRRLIEQNTSICPWQLWGPYLSERQWGTVREDYSAHGAVTANNI